MWCCGLCACCMGGVDSRSVPFGEMGLGGRFKSRRVLGSELGGISLLIDARVSADNPNLVPGEVLAQWWL